MVDEKLTAGDVMEVDVEFQKEEVDKGAYAMRLMTAAGFFLLSSYLIMNEGAVRASTVAQPMPAPFSQELLLSAAVLEVLFGLFGILVGAALLMFGLGSKLVTWSWMAVAFVFGWFTFVVYVLASSIFNIVNTDPATIPATFTLTQYRTLQVMGLFGAITWCFALQGGQFMVANMIATIQASGKTRGVGYAKARMMMWSVNAALSGIVFIIGASVTLAANGPGPYEMPIAYPPIVMIYPEMTIAAAVVLLFYGLFGVYVALTKKMFNVIGAFAALTVVVSFSMLAWGQAWSFPEVVPIPARAEPTTLLVGLSTMVVANVAYSASELQKDFAMEC